MIRQRLTTALVVASLPSADLGALSQQGLPEADLVVAADGGLEALRRAGWPVHAVVGDMDSVAEISLAWARAQGAEILTHPARKDFTDLELVMEYACKQAEVVHVIMSASGRLDHTMGNLLILASDRWATAVVTASVEGARVEVVRGLHTLSARVGETVSLLAVGEQCRVEMTSGLEYPLHDEWLDPTAARGVSNVVTAQPATIKLSEGVMLAIAPGQT